MSVYIITIAIHHLTVFKNSLNRAVSVGVCSERTFLTSKQCELETVWRIYPEHAGIAARKISPTTVYLKPILPYSTDPSLTNTLNRILYTRFSFISAVDTANCIGDGSLNSIR